MATGDFDTYYSDNPWEVMDKNQRTFIDPELIAMFRQRSLFTPTISFVKNLGDVRATKMVMSQLMDPHPDYTALALRQLWMPASHIDSREIEIVFSRYGGKVAYTIYDDLVTYWKQNGSEGIRRIMRGALGQHMIDVLDMLARNAYIQGALGTGYWLNIGGGTSFNDVGTGDIFDLDIAMDIWLGMSLRGVASALGQAGAANSIVCYTTPSVIYDVQSKASSEWVAVNQYQGIERLLAYEVGSYKNVRFVQSPKLVLWNAGAIVQQHSITAAVHAGDGAPNPTTTKVDNTWRVGQTSAGIVNYLQLDADTGLAVNDILTIHLTRTAAHGITNGVNPFEGTLHNRRVVSVDTVNHRVTFDQPIMVDMATDLGAGVYGYVTKGRNIHASIFVGGPNAIVSGVALAPRVHTPPPVDDFELVQRFSWDGYFGHQVYSPEVFEVVFSAGTTRIKGSAAVQ